MDETDILKGSTFTLTSNSCSGSN